VLEREEWEKPFQIARETIQRGDFDDTKKALEALGFRFKEATDPNHWLYYHPELRGDPHFGYPSNFYRPHGSRRSSDRISRHDLNRAKQMVEALRVVRASSQAAKESDE
jgi:hypothetical protein